MIEAAREEIAGTKPTLGLSRSFTRRMSVRPTDPLVVQFPREAIYDLSVLGCFYSSLNMLYPWKEDEDGMTPGIVPSVRSPMEL